MDALINLIGTFSKAHFFTMPHPQPKDNDAIEMFEQAPKSMQDVVAPEAIGGMDKSELPRGYFWSLKFMGTIVATSLMLISLYLGYVLPVQSSGIVTANRR